MWTGIALPARGRTEQNGMVQDGATIIAAIRAKIDEMTEPAGLNASGLGEHDLIPDAGFLDSAALIELVMWYENKFGMSLRPDEITVETLGTLDAIAKFVLERRA
jgi:D-alanine--poly(phosphoribitol) ligase subunit 2